MAEERGNDEMLNALRLHADLGLTPQRQEQIETATDRALASRDTHATARPRRATFGRARWAGAGGTALAAVAVTAGIAAFGASSSTDARASVTLLDTPPAPVTDLALVSGLRDSIGSADLRRVWSTPAFGGTAYLAKRNGDWCLSAPDPAAGDPDRERGGTCVDANAFERFGIALTVGNDYVAVLSADSKPPVLRRPNAPGEAVKPTDTGVVVLADLPTGATITRFAADGKVRQDRIGHPDVRSEICADGERHFFGPGQTCQDEVDPKK